MTHFKSSTRRHVTLGALHVLSNEKGITDIIFDDLASNITPSQPNMYSEAAVSQLEEYMAGARTSFELSLLPQGTAFQLRVWHALIKIPYGTTKTYLEVALMLGSRTLSRPVGQACNKNPIPIVIPCHRVVGSSGDLTGYRGGIKTKAWLLELEKQHMKNITSMPQEKVTMPQPL